MISLRRLAYGLSRALHDDPRMPHVCPYCTPNAKTPYFVALCPEHAGVA